MTGRDLIIYILENNMEDKNIFEIMLSTNNLLNVNKAAEKFNVGTATINAWITNGYLKAVIVNGEKYILSDSEPKGLEKHV